MTAAGNLVFEGPPAQTRLAFRGNGRQSAVGDAGAVRAHGRPHYLLKWAERSTWPSMRAGAAAPRRSNGARALAQESCLGTAAGIQAGGTQEATPTGPRRLPFQIRHLCAPARKPYPEGGRALYARTCAQCHGQLAVGGVKDLRQMTRETHAQFNDIVLKGTRVKKGMASFANLLSADDAEAVHAYLISRAQEDWGGSGGGTGDLTNPGRPLPTRLTGPPRAMSGLSRQSRLSGLSLRRGCTWTPPPLIVAMEMLAMR